MKLNLFIILFSILSSFKSYSNTRPWNNDWEWGWTNYYGVTGDYRTLECNPKGPDGYLAVVQYVSSDFGDQIGTDKVGGIWNPSVLKFNDDKPDFALPVQPRSDPYNENGKLFYDVKVRWIGVALHSVKFRGMNALDFAFPLVTKSTRSVDDVSYLEYGAKIYGAIKIYDANCALVFSCYAHVQEGNSVSDVCSYEFKVEDSFFKKDVDILNANIKSLKSLIEKIGSDDFKNTLREIKEIDSILEKLESRSFQKIEESHLGTLQWAKDKFKELKKDVDDIIETNEKKREEIITGLELIRSSVEDSLAKEGFNINDEHAFEVDSFTIDLSIEIPEIISINEEITSQNNVYDQFATLRISELNDLYRRNKRKEFLQVVIVWSKYTHDMAVLLKDRMGLYNDEFNLFQKSVSKVENYLYVSPGYLDAGLWFKDSKVSKEVRRVIKEQIKVHVPEVGHSLEKELQSWGGNRPLTEKQKNTLKTILVLGYGFEYISKNLHEAGKDALQQWKQTAHGVLEFIKDESECLAKTSIAGDFGDLYEIVSGRDLCDPNVEITTVGKIISSISLIGLNGRVFRRIAAVSGLEVTVLKAVEIGENLIDAAKKFGFRSKEQLKEFQEILRLPGFSEKFIALPRVEGFLSASKKLGIPSKDLANVSKEVSKVFKNNPCTTYIEIRNRGLFEKFLDFFITTAYASNNCKLDIVDLYEAAAKNVPLGKGSTGRAIPNNFGEQAALLVTRADPDKGTTIVRNLNDPRWLSADGWVKKSAHYKNDGRNIEIHYVFNTKTREVDDFKFK